MAYQQQGDVLLKRINGLPAKKKEMKELKTNVLKEGEHTGHAHRIAEGNFQLFEHKKKMVLLALTMLRLKHEEHAMLKVPPGEYIIDSVKEYNHLDEESRAVAD